MKKDLWKKISLKGIIFLLFSSGFALSTSAHPLGNFSVNSFSRIEVGKDQIRLHYILDMAEIPTFQESQKVDTDKSGTLDASELNAYLEQITPALLSGLSVKVDDHPIQLQVHSKNISVPLGAGNLPTLRIDWELVGNDPSASGNDAVHRFSFNNNNFDERVGWNEIVVDRSTGISVFDSNAFGSAATNEIKSYPENMLTTPLAERAAEFSFTTAAIPVESKVLQNRNGSPSAPVTKDKFAELISVPEITPGIALAGLLFAFAFGSMHAMSPGHGKTVVGAYLVGSRGTIKHAVFLGLTVTITHTLGVFALGFITLFASNYILPEKLLPILSFASGVLVFVIGISLFKERLLTALGWKSDLGHHEHTHDHDGHAHSHDHGVSDHVHEHNSNDPNTHTHGGSTHSHLPPKNMTWGSLLALGISGGLLPCPSALVLMLSAISLGRVGYGLVLTVVFSFGLAATLTAVGLIFLYVGKAFGSSGLSNNRIFKLLPVMSALVITCVGAVICYNSIA